MPTPDKRPPALKLCRLVYVEVVFNELQKNLRKVPVILASAQTDMFAAEYKLDLTILPACIAA